MSKWNRKNKDCARSMAVEYQGKTHNTALFLPSSTGLDIKEAFENNIINKKTSLVIVEKEKKCIGSIIRFLNRMKLNNYYIHNGKIDKLKLNEVLGTRKLDYMFGDFCGNMTADIANWLYKYQDCFSNQMRIPMTYAIHPRGPKTTTRKCPFVKAVDKGSDVSMFQQAIGNISMNLPPICLNSPNLVKDIRFACEALFYAFSRKKIQIENIFVYKDEIIPMMLMQVRICGTKEENPVFKRIVKYYDSFVGYNSQLIRHGRQKRKTIKKKEFVIKTANDIARKLEIYGNYKSLSDLLGAKKAWITIYANQNGLDSDKVLKKIGNRLKKYGLNAA